MRQSARSVRVRTVVAALLAATFLLGPGNAAAQREMPELPTEVKEFLERDQFFRWRNMIETGKTLYAEGSCSRCHAADGTGRSGPDLTDEEWVQSDGDLQGIRDTIFWGVRRRDFADPTRRFEMNPNGGMDLEWAEIDAIAAYVWSLSNDTGIPQQQ